MKTNTYILILFMISLVKGFSQNEPVKIMQDSLKKETKKEVIIGGYEHQNSGIPIDTNILEVGNKIFIFIEYDNGMIIDRVDTKTGEKKRLLDLNEKDFESGKDSSKMRGHWSGFEYGLNNFMNRDYNFELPSGAGYMELNTWRSWNFNFNFSQSTTPLINDWLAAIGGLGLTFNQYNFAGGNNIQLNETTGEVEERVFTGFASINKSKLNTLYLTMPFLLELQLGPGMGKDKFYVSAGVVGGVRIASKMKVVHGEQGQKKKIVEKREDLNLNRWRLDATARLGYKDYINVYASYALTTLFEKNKGPELYPLSVGLRVNFGE